MNLVIEPKRTLAGPERPNTGKNKNKKTNKVHAQTNQRRNRSAPERKNTADCPGKTKISSYEYSERATKEKPEARRPPIELRPPKKRDDKELRSAINIESTRTSLCSRSRVYGWEFQFWQSRSMWPFWPHLWHFVGGQLRNECMIA